MLPMTSNTLIRTTENVADLLEQLDGIPGWRVRLHPAPGTATEHDVLEVHARTKRVCELIDGVLVEKAMGWRESFLAMTIAQILYQFVREHRLGVVVGPDAPYRLSVGRVRLPDVSFVSWKRMPGGRLPTEPIPNLAPDLAVEVLSASNTASEMATKRQNDFSAGTRLVWQIDPATRSAEVYTGPDDCTKLDESQSLDGSAIVPGFVLPLHELFDRLDEQAPPN